MESVHFLEVNFIKNFNPDIMKREKRQFNLGGGAVDWEHQSWVAEKVIGDQSVQGHVIATERNLLETCMGCEEDFKDFCITLW